MCRRALRRAIAWVVPVAGMLVGCSDRPDGVLSDSEMESLMTDLLLADAYNQTGNARQLPDSVRATLGEAVLRRHGVDHATLDSTYAWYARNLDDYYKLYDRVERRVAKSRAKVSPTGGGDVENDIWNLPKLVMFSPAARGNSLVFSLPGTSIAKGDRLEWKMHLSSDTEGDVMLGVDYTDGTSSVSRIEIAGKRSASLQVIADTSRTPSRVYGSIIVEARQLPVWADSISLAHQPYDSVAYLGFRMQRLLTPPAKRVVRTQPIVQEALGSQPSASTPQSGALPQSTPQSGALPASAGSAIRQSSGAAPAVGASKSEPPARFINAETVDPHRPGRK